MIEPAPIDPKAGAQRQVWIVEDEPAAAALAAELCESCGAAPVLYASPLPFLAALRASPAPVAVVLDWRLEREVSAALFLAVRHRAPGMPVVYWTGCPRSSLPAMVLADPLTRVVDKAAGTLAFEHALAWAVGDESG